MWNGLILKIFKKQTMKRPESASPVDRSPPKRVRWQKSLREECEDAIDVIDIDGSPARRYRAMLLVARVLLHVANRTEASSAALHCIELMRLAVDGVEDGVGV
jgi:hypothetical protein